MRSRTTRSCGGRRVLISIALHALHLSGSMALYIPSKEFLKFIRTFAKKVVKGDGLRQTAKLSLVPAPLYRHPSSSA